MFATLRYNQTTKTIEQSSRPASLRACTYCRARKLRCSAAEDGCDRCKAKKLRCEYPQPVRRRGPRLTKSTSSNSVPGHKVAPTDAKSANTTSMSVVAWRPDTERQDHDTSAVPRRKASSGHNDIFILPESGSITTVDKDQSSHGSVSQEFPNSFELALPEEIDMSNLSQGVDAWLSPETLVSPGTDNALQAALPNIFSSLNPSWSIPSSHNVSAVDISCSNLIQEISSFPSYELCNCQVIALRLQESSCIIESQCSLRNMGRVLQTNKQILVQCSSLVKCALCSRLSHFMMLLTTICQRITSCFDKALVMLTQQYNRLSYQRRQEPHFDLPNDEEDEGGYQMMVRGYDLDAKEEPCVFGILALVQLRKLRAILNHIREVTITQHWKPHTTIIDQTATEVFKQISLFDKTKE